MIGLLCALQASSGQPISDLTLVKWSVCFKPFNTEKLISVNYFMPGHFVGIFFSFFKALEQI